MNETINPQETAPQPVINQAPQPQAAQEEIISPPPPKNKNILAIILSNLLIIALGVAGYFAYTYYQPTQNTEVKEKAIETIPTPSSQSTSDSIKTEKNILNFYKVTVSLKDGKDYVEKYHFLAKYLNQLFKFPSVDNPLEEFSKIAFNTTLNSPWSENQTTNTYYVVLKSQKIDLTKKYSDEYAEVSVEPAETSLYPYIIDVEYCEQDTDCTIRTEFCTEGAFNNYHKFADVWGCAVTQYKEQYPYWGSESESLSCKIEMQFEGAKCISNKCIETNPQPTCLEDQDSYLP